MPFISGFGVHKHEYIDVHAAVHVVFQMNCSKVKRTVSHSPPTLHSLFATHIKEVENISDDKPIPHDCWNTHMQQLHHTIDAHLTPHIHQFQSCLSQHNTTRAWDIMWGHITLGLKHHVQGQGHEQDWASYGKVKFRSKRLFAKVKVDRSGGNLAEAASTEHAKHLLTQMRRAKHLESIILKKNSTVAEDGNHSLRNNTLNAIIQHVRDDDAIPANISQALMPPPMPTYLPHLFLPNCLSNTTPPCSTKLTNNISLEGENNGRTR